MRQRSPIGLSAAIAFVTLAAPFLFAAENEPPFPPALAAPYDLSPDHVWNKIHRALFIRRLDEKPYLHTLDPLLYHGGTFLLKGDPHTQAIALLDEFLTTHGENLIAAPLQRAYFQRDLWAAFDYAAWIPDDWVFKNADEPAAIALRTRLSQMIKRLQQSPEQLAALPDTYTLALQSKEFPTGYDPKNPTRPFLPVNLFDPTGPWVRIHEQSAEPGAPDHTEGAGGRAAHLIFLNLPDGRAATQAFIKQHAPASITQIPTGTMVAMIRRPFAIDTQNKIRVLPITELVEIRVYKRIPPERDANMHGDFGEQDVFEFKLNRAAFFSGKHGLKPLEKSATDLPFSRTSDIFESQPLRVKEETPALQVCIGCHQAPGVQSVLSLQRTLDKNEKHFRGFYTCKEDVELSYTVKWKTKRFDWGLLQGLLEK